MPINESYYGFVESTTDALLLFEACEKGVLPKISRRLQDKERGIIRSGSVFIFDERESGIKRWTDGRVWSPSRILGNFLVYRELDGRETLHQRQQFDSRYNSPYYFSRPIDNNDRHEGVAAHSNNNDKLKDRNLLGSLTDTYKFLRNGLVKKTISIQIDGRNQHLISYYTKGDVITGKLSTPSSSPELSSLEISPELILGQSFRVPPSVEFAESILKGPTLSPPSSISTTSTVSTLLPSPQYSGYEDHSYHRKSFESNDFSMPPISTVIPNYHQERPKYYNAIQQGFTNQPLSSKEREFPNLELMTESNVYKIDRKYTLSLPSPSSLIMSADKTINHNNPPNTNLIDMLYKSDNDDHFKPTKKHYF